MNRRDMAWGGTLAAFAVAAGTIASQSAYADSTGDVLAAIEEYRKSMVDGNGARLLEMSADDMSFGHANGVVQTKVEFVKTVVDKVEVFHSIKLYDHSIRCLRDVSGQRPEFPAEHCSGVEEGRWTLASVHAPVFQAADLIDQSSNAD
jgi:hypothetical protein